MLAPAVYIVLYSVSLIVCVHTCVSTIRFLMKLHAGFSLTAELVALACWVSWSCAISAK